MGLSNETQNLIVNLFNKGTPSKEIAEELNKAGHKTASGQTWNYNRVATTINRLGFRKYKKRRKKRTVTATPKKVKPKQQTFVLDAVVELKTESLDQHIRKVVAETLTKGLTLQ